MLDMGVHMLNEMIYVVIAPATPRFGVAANMDARRFTWPGPEQQLLQTVCVGFPFPSSVHSVDGKSNSRRVCHVRPKNNHSSYGPGDRAVGIGRMK